MKGIAIAGLALLSFVGTAMAQVDVKVELFTDQGMSQCGLTATPDQLVSVHVFVTGSSDITEVRFSAPKPVCWTGATWLADEIDPSLIWIGTSQHDLEVAFGTCRTPPLYLGRILYHVTGFDLSCCPYPVKPSEGAYAITATDCTFEEWPASAGQQVMINPTAACPDCATPPPPPPPPPSAYRVSLFADAGMSTCELSPQPGLVSVHMFETGTGSATMVRFRAPKPSCWTSASWLTDQIAPGLIWIGNSQSDLAIAFGACLNPPTYLGSILYSVQGSSGQCCPYPVMSVPGVGLIATDCVFQDWMADAGQQVMINPTSACPNCTDLPLPVHPTTWGAVKALYR